MRDGQLRLRSMREEETPQSLSSSCSSSSARLREERSRAEQDAEPRAFILKNSPEQLRRTCCCCWASLWQRQGQGSARREW